MTYRVLHNETEQFHGTLSECIAFMHHKLPYPIEHATRFEGWRIELAEEEK